MRLASYNVENLFLRAEALNQETWADGKDALEKQRQINVLFQKKRYSPAYKKRILAKWRSGAGGERARALLAEPARR